VQEQAYGGADHCCSEQFEAGRSVDDVVRRQPSHDLWVEAKFGGLVAARRSSCVC
jgi:hypothetical protein